MGVAKVGVGTIGASGLAVGLIGACTGAVAGSEAQAVKYEQIVRKSRSKKNFERINFAERVGWMPVSLKDQNEAVIATRHKT